MLDHERADAGPAGSRAPSEEELLAAGDRVAELLEELRTIVGPSAWLRVEELVQRLLELYGAGLARVLRHAAAAERGEGALAERLGADELVSSLLLLHGLHPAPTEERVARALEEVRARVGGHDLQLIGIDADGTVRLRATPDARSCPSSGATVARAIERTILEAAPEVTRVQVDGLAAPAAREPLVRLGGRDGGAP
jgi:Fe-S cluster biogenesis protein NfuA